MSIINNMPSGGLNINGLIEEYYVYAGENISAGSFVEFVNGVGSIVTNTSSPMPIESADGYSERSSSCMVSTNKVFIAYRCSSTLACAAIVTINNLKVSLGTVYTITSTQNIAITRSVLIDTNKVLMVTQNNTAKYGEAIVATISGDTISFSQSAQYHSSTVGEIDACYVSANKAVIFYESSNIGYDLIANVSGTSITFGTKYQFMSASIDEVSSGLSASNKVLLCYTRYTETQTAHLKTVNISGNAISHGSEYKATSTKSSTCNVAIVDTNKGILQWEDGGADNFTYSVRAKSVTVNGNSITFGTELNFHTGRTDYTACIPLDTNKAICAYSSAGKVRVLQLSGTTVTAGDVFTFASVTTSSINLTKIDENTFMVSWEGNDFDSRPLYPLRVVDNVITNKIDVTNYETQVRNTTTNTPNGVAKTGGTGGTATLHKDKITIYVPDI